MTQYTLTQDVTLNIIATYYLNGNFRILRRKGVVLEHRDEYTSYCFYDVASDKKVSEWAEGTLVYPIVMPKGTVVHFVKEVPLVDCNKDCLKVEVISSPDKDFEDLRGLLLTRDDSLTIMEASNDG